MTFLSKTTNCQETFGNQPFILNRIAIQLVVGFSMGMKA